MQKRYIYPLIVLWLRGITLSECRCIDEAGPDIASLCDVDGNYNIERCEFSRGQCFCVDRITGVEISGTATDIGNDRVDCSAVQLSISPPFATKTSELIETTVTTMTTTTQPTVSLAAKPVDEPAEETMGTPQSEDMEIMFDENDICYKQNKATYDHWNEKMKKYEEQVQRWQRSMEEYEQYIKSLEESQEN